MMKNILVLMTMALALLFIGCGAEEAAAPAEEAQSEAEAASNETFSAREFVEEYIADLENGNKIYPMDTFVERLREGEDLYVVDNRRAEDYNEGHVRGAINIPWGTPAMWESIPHIPQDRPVYMHCYTGQTCGQATIMMRMAGIDAYSVNSGWNLGISQQEGFEEIVETTPNELDESVSYDVPAGALDEIQEYYESTFALSGTFANRMVSAEDAHAILQAEEDSAMVISMCRPDDFAEQHIEGSVNIPYGPNWNDAIAGLPTDKKLIIHCYSGQGSNQLVAMLTMLGYDPVSMKFGLGTPRTAPRGWVNEGFPVVSSN